ncbi:MAG TPA: ubiquinol-cytochrome c reductase iron-sulfur subunit N-terminal domain-containing protein, partial [Dongiaceae bacterium]
MAHSAPASSHSGGQHDSGGTRRDFLFLATGAMGAAGIAAVAWPFIDQMNPSADVLAL